MVINLTALREVYRIRILACDLSMTCPAFSIIDIVNNEAFVVEIRIQNNKYNIKKGHGCRLTLINKVLEGIKRDYSDIDEIVRERAFTKGITVTQILFKVVGATEQKMYELWGQKQIYEISPTTVKRLIAGDGKASKKEVEDGVRKFLTANQKNINFITDDASDSVAVGLSHGIKRGLLG